MILIQSTFSVLFHNFVTFLKKHISIGSVQTHLYSFTNRLPNTFTDLHQAEMGLLSPYNIHQKDGTNFKSAPDAVRHFLSPSQGNLAVLLLQTSNSQVTVARIYDTLEDVLLVTPELVSLAKPKMLCVVNYSEDIEFQSMLQTLVEKQSQKVVVLHELNKPPLLELTDATIRNATDPLLEWSDLTDAFQAELIGKVEVACGGLKVNVEIFSELLHGAALELLVVSQPSSSLLGEILGIRVDEIFSSLDLTLSDPMTDLGRIAANQLFPNWHQEIYPYGMKIMNEKLINTLVAGAVLKRTLTKINFEYAFVNEWVCHYFFARFMKSPSAKNLNGLSLSLLTLRQVDIPLPVNEGFLHSFEFVNKSAVYFTDLFTSPKDKMKKEGWGDLESTALACIAGGYRNLLSCILQRHPVTDKMLVAACVAGDTSTFDILAQAYSKASEGRLLPAALENFEGITLLHVAVWEGHLSLTTSLLLQYNFARRLCEEYMEDLVHVSVANTLRRSSEVKSRKIEIVNIITSLNPKLLNAEVDINGRTGSPVFCSEVDLRLIKHLGELGADLNKSTSSGTTLAHGISAGRNPAQFHEAVKYLAENGHKELLKSTNAKDKDTPLHHAIQRLDVLEWTLDIFEEAGVGVHEACLKNSNMICDAIKFGRSPEFIQLLVQKGADWRAKDSAGDTALLMATERGDTDIIRYLVSLGANANQKGNGGMAPLHKILVSPTGNELEVVKTLVELGADINLADGKKNTPLSLAWRGREKRLISYETIRFLRDHGAKAKYWVKG